MVIQSGLAGEQGLNYMDFLTEEEYSSGAGKSSKDNQYLDDTDPNKFIARMGADALYMLLSGLILRNYHTIFVTNKY
ncbi:MAG: hypothetical protein R2850_02805 [Bacteroidia bacterium]